MTALFQPRRQAEEFAARVDAPASSTVDARSDRLLGVVGELRRQGQVLLADPRPEFTAELRARLIAEAATVLEQQPTFTLPVRQRGRRERRLVVAATVAVLVGGSAGMAAASQQALPGDALYPVKRAIEQVQAGTAVSPDAEGRALLSQASGRLEEVRGLLDSGSGAATAEVPGTLEEFRSQARAGADKLMTSYRDTGEPDSIATVRQFTVENLEVLHDLTDGAPAGVGLPLRDAAKTLQSIDRDASALCPDCTTPSALQLSPGLTVSPEAGRAPASAPDDASKLDKQHPVLVPEDLVHATEAGVSEPAVTLPESTASSAASPSSQPSAPAATATVSESNVALPGPSDTASVAPTPQPTVLSSGPPTPQPTSTESAVQDTESASPSDSTGAPSIGTSIGGSADVSPSDVPTTPTVSSPPP